MHKSPVCGNFLVGRSKKLTILKHSKYCPYCETLLTKKKSPVFLLLSGILAVCGANFKTHWAFALVTIVIAVLLLILIHRLPYVPYDK